MNSNHPIPASQSTVFWGEIAPCEHIAQFYEHDDVLLDTLAGFVGGGLKQGEGVILLATGEHLEALEQRLRAMRRGFATNEIAGPIYCHCC